MGVIYLNGISYAGGGSGGGGGTTDYNELSNKPTINGVILAKGMTTDDWNLVDDETVYIDANGKIAAYTASSGDIENLFN